MQLAKPCLDVGLSTNQVKRHLAFWREEAGLVFDHRLPIAPGHVQHRFLANGSVVKVNSFAGPLVPVSSCGIREVLIARQGLAAPRYLTDPDGALTTLVPKGFAGIGQIGIRIAVRDMFAQRRFYAEALGLPEEAPGKFRAGETLIMLEPEDTAPPGPEIPGAGWRYMTFQVHKADEAHARVLALGASEAKAPVTLGKVARYSIVRDPEGNAIELSQRASTVGSLE